MDRKTFESQMQLVQAKLQTSDRPEYWQGYQMGLMRQYHGESFMTVEEHREWMAKAKAEDNETFEMGKGYMDGLLA